MKLQDQLKIVKLANKVMTDYPKAKTLIARLQWIKQANELLKLKLQQTETLPDNQYVKQLQDIIGGKMDSKRILDVFNDLSTCIYGLGEMGLLDGGVASLAHNAISYWAKKERTHAI